MSIRNQTIVFLIFVCTEVEFHSFLFRSGVRGLPSRLVEDAAAAAVVGRLLRDAHSTRNR